MQSADSVIPFVSVVIPTYNDWSKLQLCLDALVCQEYPKHRVEVIVVNNKPSDVCPFELPLDNMKLISEGAPGSYAARNAGIAVSRGDIVAFTDSDCLPDARWLKEAVAEIGRGADRVGGKVTLFYRGDRLNYAELYEKVFSFDQAANIEVFGASVTANTVVRRAMFDKVGLFNASLMSGGDMEWGSRASAAGYSIVYSEKAVVRHPARSRLDELLKKSRRVTGGSISLAVAPASRRKYAILHGLLPPISSYRRLREHPDLSLLQKLRVFGIAYILKLHQTYHRALLLSGISKPSR